ncbi:MAG: UDP-N-acetylmuramate--L-alanine ligase [Caldisericia bacterium]|nr:UDP-N-acetylmuramate--L-alanine ligase [Caldisericia bacterium]
MLNLNKFKKVHLIGIGGVGMTPLAIYLKDAGFDVTGSDIQDFRFKNVLMSKGIKVNIGHSSENVPPDAVVIYSSALNSDNIELQTAKRQNNQIISRIEALKEISKDKKLIAITGSYGKSTATSFVSAILEEANLNPSWIIGADLFNFKPANIGSSDLLVLECDESKKDFLEFNPFFVILTNIGNDHLSNYENSKENLYIAILSFLKRISEMGVIFLNADDPMSERIINDLKSSSKKIVKCGKTDNADYVYKIKSSNFNHKRIVTSFSVKEKDSNVFTAQINMPGERNVLDACFAYAVLIELGIRKEIARNLLKALPILDRRFEIRHIGEKALIIDDEGDSPFVIETVLKDARYYFPNKKILSIVQPHRYSRLKSLFSQYVSVLSNYSDDIIITPVYEASESKIEGIDSFSLGSAIRKTSFKGNVEVVSSLSEAANMAKFYFKKDYVIITLGPGNIWQVADELSN